MKGPLRGTRVLELAGLGGLPFAGMLLADLGADVIRIDRPTANQSARPDLLGRGKRSIALDLKSDEGREIVLRLAADADVLLEGYRPGVTERLRIGPDEVRSRNERLIYGRLSGWGREGPYANKAGHDINFAGLSGVIYHLGRDKDSPPSPPLSLVGDFGGGGMLLVCGVLAALLSRASTGRGQVVDAAILDGAALIATYFFNGVLDGPRGSAMPSGASHYYDVYATADDGYVAVGAIEPQFYAQFAETLGFGADELPQSSDSSQWPQLKSKVAGRFATRTRDDWETAFRLRDGCVSPVLSVHEAPAHPHNRARGVFIEIDGQAQPAPAPRFSETMMSPPAAPPRIGADSAQVLAELGFGADDVDDLAARGVVAVATSPGGVRADT